MNFFSPIEVTKNYAVSGVKKSERSFGRMFILSLLAGLMIAFGAASVNTATHSIGNVSAARVISGLLFPFGLGMVMLCGAELFTGNCMIAVSVLEGMLSTSRMLRSWICVYIGNFAGSILLAAGCAFFGQFDYSGGGLALFTIRVAAAKCAIPFFSGVILGFFCNVLVCLGVLCSISAKDTAGRILGAYIPVSLFVICGFEHSIANMYFIPAGIFASRMVKYSTLAVQAGLDVSSLTWQNFLTQNLLPVTIGNIAGGVFVGVVMWAGHLRGAERQ
ncbi:MAG: formate/nitrite transporter family protein [Synergistaceae bacterium]|nr:formate/nitrite transporter family protein [Synergistaceae bacterium]